MALRLTVEPQCERESTTAQMRHHTALTAAAFVFGAEHEELRVALRLPRCKPVFVRLEAVLRKMMLGVEELARSEADPRMFFRLERGQTPRQVFASAPDVVNRERAR